MKKWLVILLSLELLIAILLGQSSVVCRADFERALTAQFRNPTPENQMELERQRQINVLYRWRLSAVTFGQMAGVTLLGLYIIHRRRALARAGE
ncbi:MAG: hypothetical protein PHD76_01735 [Methylacidiphilales bacterium]|nr:hypothetical protein [Candidatus Methylacidiphilales bacterium]